MLISGWNIRIDGLGIPEVEVGEGVVAQSGQQSVVVAGMTADLLIGEEVGAENRERGQVVHAAETGHLVKGRQKLHDCVVVIFFPGINGFAAPGADHRQGLLAMQGSPLAAIGEVVFQNQVDPFLHQRGTTVPVKGVLPDEDIVSEQKLLLLAYPDVKVRIAVIQVMEGDPDDRSCSVSQAFVDPGFMEGGVCKYDQYLVHVV